MTREEKQKAIDVLKISVPIKALTQEEFNDYIQTINQVMDWLEQEPCEDATLKDIFCMGCEYKEPTNKNDVAQERYQDLIEYFGSKEVAKTILEDRKEFKAWLERLRWNTKKVDELARELEQIKGANKNDLGVEKIEVRKPCINYEDGCEEWAGCPCVYYKVESEETK